MTLPGPDSDHSDTPLDIDSPHSTAAVRRPAWVAATSGIVAAAVALAAGEFAAALASPRPGPVIAVANRIIDKAPTWFVQFGKDLFGLSDKPALIVGTVLTSLLLGALFGLLSRTSPRPGIIGIALFGVVGFGALAADAQAGPISALLIAGTAVAAGIATFCFLFAKSGPTPAQALSMRSTEPNAEQTRAVVVPVPRRSFLGWAGTATVVAAAGGIASNTLRGRSAASRARDAVTLPVTGNQPETLAAIEEIVTVADAGPIGSIEGISSIITPNDDFYLIDTALLTPQIDPAGWKLTIKGMVDNEISYTYDELLARATTIAPVTLSCVSNEIGGTLVGNAVWQGVPLVELLDEAGVQSGATQIRSASVDGWDCGFPTELAYDGRTALVAVAMNGEPLPLKHGFPARIVIAGLYGYVSATKWLKDIELTTMEAFDGYWIPRGWAKEAPIKTQSRIDTPKSGARLTAGDEVPIAGVAWAPHRGITKVEVQVDEGEWLEAELGESLGLNAWRQWYLPWIATPGRHQLRVRATDGENVTQTELRTAPAPDGASGWHSISVNV